MTIYERAKAVQGAYGLKNRKEVIDSKIKVSYEKHFQDSVNYQENTLVDGKPQKLIVARNKNVTTEKKIYAYPGETFSLGSVVDCYDCKWLVTAIDPDDEQYFNGRMTQCNRSIVWQDDVSLDIIERWITMDKPYFSNLDENKRTSISSRMYKLYLPYDKDTSKLYVGKRLLLEIVNDKPITYRITSVDSSTQRYMFKGEVRGLICLYVEQDQYNPITDNAELMICDYKEKSSKTTLLSALLSIKFRGSSDLKIGGSAKTFTAECKDSKGKTLQFKPVWKVRVLDEYSEYVNYSIEDDKLKVKVLPNRLMEGATIRIELSAEGCDSTYIECKVVDLI